MHSSVKKIMMGLLFPCFALNAHCGSRDAKFTIDSLSDRILHSLISHGRHDLAKKVNYYMDQYVMLVDAFADWRDPRTKDEHIEGFNKMLAEFESEFVSEVLEDKNLNEIKIDLKLLVCHLRGLIKAVKETNSSMGLIPLWKKFGHLLPSRALSAYKWTEMVRAMNVRYS